MEGEPDLVVTYYREGEHCTWYLYVTNLSTGVLVLRFRKPYRILEVHELQVLRQGRNLTLLGRCGYLTLTCPPQQEPLKVWCEVSYVRSNKTLKLRLHLTPQYPIPQLTLLTTIPTDLCYLSRTRPAPTSTLPLGVRRVLLWTFTNMSRGTELELVLVLREEPGWGVLRLPPLTIVITYPLAELRRQYNEVSRYLQLLSKVRSEVMSAEYFLESTEENLTQVIKYVDLLYENFLRASEETEEVGRVLEDLVPLLEKLNSYLTTALHLATQVRSHAHTLLTYLENTNLSQGAKSTLRDLVTRVDKFLSRVLKVRQNLHTLYTKVSTLYLSTETLSLTYLRIAGQLLSLREQVQYLLSDVKRLRALLSDYSTSIEVRWRSTTRLLQYLHHVLESTRELLPFNTTAPIRVLTLVYTERVEVTLFDLVSKVRREVSTHRSEEEVVGPHSSLRPPPLLTTVLLTTLTIALLICYTRWWRGRRKRRVYCGELMRELEEVDRELRRLRRCVVEERTPHEKS